MLAWYEDWSDLSNDILWSDEAVFHIGGFVNLHNWAGEDPLVISESMQNRPKVAVLCGMTSGRIVGPLILHNTMNAERHFTLPCCR